MVIAARCLLIWRLIASMRVLLIRRMAQYSIHLLAAAPATICRQRAAAECPRALDLGILQAAVVGIIATTVGVRLTVQRTVAAGPSRAWCVAGPTTSAMPIGSPFAPPAGCSPVRMRPHGGIVVGEAYRVDQDRLARRALEPADRSTWGQGGTAPLLIDPCRSGSTHAWSSASPADSRPPRSASPPCSPGAAPPWCSMTEPPVPLRL